MALFDVNGLRALVGSIRPIASALHTTRVTVRTRTWEDEVGTGDFTDSDFLLGQEVRVSKMTTNEVVTSGGFFEFDDVKVEHITPPYPGGGYSLEQIAPSTRAEIPPGVEYIYLLTGDITGTYRFKNVVEDKALHYTLFLSEEKTTSAAHAR